MGDKYNMDKKNIPIKLSELRKPIDSKKPDENIGYYFSSHIKIHDPESKKVYVQKRADT